MDKITIHHLHSLKERGEPIVMLTCYDYPTATVLDQCGVDVVLVGDSLGMVVYGFENTLPVTMDMMVLHCQAVRRGVRRAFLIGDMPFMSYQTGTADALRNAGRLLAEGGADAVKLEGGQAVVETVRALVEAGIAVQGHIGLTPQSVSQMGGFRMQGKTVEAARRLIAEARALEQAGVFSLVLESIPAQLADLITRTISIPTLGIGAGPSCDGQVLVTHDLLGLFERFTPRFARRYTELADNMRTAFSAYRDDVHTRAFPAEEHTYRLPDDTWQAILSALDGNGA
ncbi:MAG: 3-methyl-2-oxobutanoate hydroxymethyltransferase [Chloroflexi bacterium]|nr:3-methyl-2-oxobutanoate hydroxymethyltransferase [Chloroflexota bacterium]